MQDIWNTTWYPKASDHINTEKTWYIVDATDKILGRLASTIANHIRGKNLVTYTPSVDMGSFVIVVRISAFIICNWHGSAVFYGLLLLRNKLICYISQVLVEHLSR